MRVGKVFSVQIRDPYQVIGVAKNADFIEIKKKYFKLVKKHHPDLNQDDHDNDKVFRRIQDAYEMIKEDRGMKVRMGYRASDDDDDDFESARPNASDYE